MIKPIELVISRGKPAPDLFLHAARQMGVDPAACVVVEDSRPGVQAARAAGMRAFGYAGGLTPAERLEGDDTVVFHDMRNCRPSSRRGDRPSSAACLRFRCCESPKRRR
jgi:beta-phosphoglucomutase-like phosphatase (HAD superfamily)